EPTRRHRASEATFTPSRNPAASRAVPRTWRSAGAGAPPSFGAWRLYSNRVRGGPPTQTPYCVAGDRHAVRLASPSTAARRIRGRPVVAQRRATARPRADLADRHARARGEPERERVSHLRNGLGGTAPLLRRNRLRRLSPAIRHRHARARVDRRRSLQARR